MAASNPPPEKAFYKIGEVAALVGVEPHVLRYWESELPALRPKKTRGAHRHYGPKDVELAMLVRRLVYEEGYSLQGVRRRLKEMGQHRRDAPPEARAKRELGLRGELLAVRRELVGLLDELDAAKTAEVPRPTQATVQDVVPAKVFVPKRNAP
jgi:DNA-binding transcriptional MerR regulator